MPVVYEIAAGTCIFDSAYELNILKTPDVTFIGPGNRNVGGAQLSGGNASVRFFLSGDRNEEYGPWKLPDFDRQRFEQAGQVIRDFMDHPSQYKQSSARGNVSIVANNKLDIAVTTGFTSSELRLPRSELGGNSINGMWQAAVHGDAYRTGPGVDNPFHTAGFDLGGYLWETPGMIGLRDAKQTTNRFIGNSTANWRPITWLALSGMPASTSSVGGIKCWTGSARSPTLPRSFHRPQIPATRTGALPRTVGERQPGRHARGPR